MFLPITTTLEGMSPKDVQVFLYIYPSFKICIDIHNLPAKHLLDEVRFIVFLFMIPKSIYFPPKKQ